jgi:hypothetical protein
MEMTMSNRDLENTIAYLQRRELQDLTSDRDINRYMEADKGLGYCCVSFSKAIRSDR